MGFRMLLKQTTSRSKAISLTPLIDVVFILLLFFMLSSSFSRWFALDVSMPQETKQELSESTRIRIMNNAGLLGLNDTYFQGSNAEFIHQLKQQASQVILLDAEHQVSTQTIVSLIDYLSHQGIEAISIGNTFEQQSIH